MRARQIVKLKSLLSGTITVGENIHIIVEAWEKAVEQYMLEINPHPEKVLTLNSLARRIVSNPKFFINHSNFA